MTKPSGGIVRVQKRDNSYAIIDPWFLSDTRLSLKSKGLLAYLLSKPSNWRVYVSDIVKRSTDGKAAVYSALKELESAGYIERHQTRENGRITGYETVVYERPLLDDEPVPENRKVESKPVADSSYSENQDMEKSNAENQTQVLKNLNNNDLQNECMNDAADPILPALSRHLSTIPLNDTHSIGDFYFADIYSALVRHFPDRLDPEVIALAAEQYAYAAIDVRTNLPKIDVANPVGLFVESYRTALTQATAQRYRRRAGG